MKTSTFVMRDSIWIIVLLILSIEQVLAQIPELKKTMKNADRIQPRKANPRYWLYKGKPVMFLGGSETDHIFY